VPTFSWKSIAELRHPRAHPVAVPLADGRVLVARGTVKVYDPQYQVLDVTAAEVWDPRRKRWSAADDLVNPQGELVGVRGLEWNAATRRWKQVDHLPQPVTPGSIVLPDGAVLSAGGAEWKGGKPYGKRETEHAKTRLRPGRGRPQPAPLKHGRINAVLTLLPDRRVLVTGGYEASLDFSWETTHRSVAQAELIDLETGEVSEGGTLARARQDHAAILLPDGGVLLIGGRHDEGSELRQVELGRLE
jgi:hypothetical protein